MKVFNLGAAAAHLNLHPHKRFVVSALVVALWSLPLLRLQKSPSSTSDLQFKWKHAERARWHLPADYSQAHQRAFSATIPLQIPLKQKLFRKGQKSQNVSDEQICTLICDLWFSCTLPSNDFMKDWFRLVPSQTITFSFTADFQDIKHVGFDLVCLFACHLPYRV